MISKRVGLPFDLLYLIDGDVENFVKHKKGNGVTVSTSVKSDGVLVASFEKKLERKKV